MLTLGFPPFTSQSEVLLMIINKLLFGTYPGVLNTEVSSFQGVGIEGSTEVSSFQGIEIERFHCITDSKHLYTSCDLGSYR